MALLIGYGAGAINPYLAFESIEDMVAEDLHGLGGIDPHKAVKNYIKAAGKGVLKVMSQDGRQHRRQLHRRADLRGHRPRPASWSTSTSPAPSAASAASASTRSPPRWRPATRAAHPTATRGAGPPQARARRRVPVAPRGRGPPVQPGDRVQAAARHAGQALRHLQAVHRAGRRPGAASWPRCAGCSPSRTAIASRCRSTRSSRSARSSSGSPPGR